ncbi:MAG: cell division protein ZapE [Pseudomonadota bacterium]
MINFPSNITLDSAQQELLIKLEKFISKERGNKSCFLGRFFRKKSKAEVKSGVYVYGGVGTGKTMLSKAFFEASPKKKAFLHYQDFMSSVHKSLHSISQGEDLANAIPLLAQDYRERIELLCLDEFEIKDIADAMIIGRLFREMIKRDIFILITSNTKPRDLYKDGMQREIFLPFIDFIEDRFEVCCLDLRWDYRKNDSLPAEHVLYPISFETTLKMKKIKEDLIGEGVCIPKILEVFGRELTLLKTYQSILITDFEELCQQNLSYNDYIEICKQFSVIVLENVPILPKDNTDQVIRFINLIDNIYFHRILLFTSLQAAPDELYKEGPRSKEFKRTISRLREMQSSSYGITSN